MPPEQLHAFLVGQMYPQQQVIDVVSKGSDPDTAFVVTAACSASALWAAMCVVLDHIPRETIERIHVSVIHDLTEMYKEENQTTLSLEELRARIINAWSRIWEAGTAQQDSSGRASRQHIVQAACRLVNQGQLDQAKVAALETLLEQKYLTAEGHWRMLKRNRQV